MMKITAFLLDLTNDYPIDGSSVAQRIRRAGKQHLWSEREFGNIDTIVIHYASAIKIEPKRPFDLYLIIKIFCDLGVSSHYIINRKGMVFLLVPEGKKAWHCGGSIMPPPDGRQGVNEFSIGIELIATENSGFTKKQYASIKRLRLAIERRYGKPFKIVGHEDIAGEKAVNLGLRTDRKIDPGNKFDWKAI
jgi:N-acetyl-anhydromuramyl-L-alanine amidase AmpD